MRNGTLPNSHWADLLLLAATQVLFLSGYLLVNIVCPSRATQALGLPVMWLLAMAYWKYIRRARGVIGVFVTVLLVLVCVAVGGSTLVAVDKVSAKESTTGVSCNRAEDLASRYQKARLLEKKGRLNEAQVEYERLLNLANNEPDIHFAFAALQLKLGNHGQARTHFRRAEELYPVGSPWKQKAREVLERLDRRGQ